MDSNRALGYSQSQTSPLGTSTVARVHAIEGPEYVFERGCGNTLPIIPDADNRTIVIATGPEFNSGLRRAVLHRVAKHILHGSAEELGIARQATRIK